MESHRQPELLLELELAAPKIGALLRWLELELQGLPSLHWLPTRRFGSPWMRPTVLRQIERQRWELDLSPVRHQTQESSILVGSCFDFEFAERTGWQLGFPLVTWARRSD